MEFLSILPNLSIGVICVLALVYVVLKFLDALKEMRGSHEKAMHEREMAMRNVEADVRKNLTEVLSKATIAIDSNSKVMGRVIRHLDGEKH